jgi:hypothetical protein
MHLQRTSADIQKRVSFLGLDAVLVEGLTTPGVSFTVSGDLKSGVGKAPPRVRTALRRAAAAERC